MRSHNCLGRGTVLPHDGKKGRRGQQLVRAGRKGCPCSDLAAGRHGQLRFLALRQSYPYHASHWSGRGGQQACDYAATKGIILGIESHGGITSKASNILEILRRVDSPYAGCNLDISNFQENPYQQIEACVPYATHTHVRDFYSESKKPLDLDRVWQIFAKAGYKGYMSAEYEGDEDPMTGVPKLIEKIRTLCKKYSSV